MRIAHFSDTYLPTHDGVSHFLSYMGPELAREGHPVTLFTPGAPGAPHAEEPFPGFRVVRFPSFALPYYPEYRWSPLPWVVGKGGEGGFDVVHLHTPGPVGTLGLFSARHWGLPVVGTFHTNLRDMQGSLPDNWLTRGFFRWAWRWNAGVYARCDRVTTPEQGGLELLDREFTRRRAPLETIPHGVDTRRYAPGVAGVDWRSRLGAGERPLVLFLGRWTQDKGVHRFLDALGELPRALPFLGVLAGQGPESRSVEERLAREPGLAGRVVSVGAVPEEEKPSLLSQSALFVLPSVADLQPLALLEAMSSGAVPVVGSRGGPARIVKDGECGLLIDPLDREALTGAIQGLLEEPARRRSLGRAARQRVEESYSQAATLRRFLEVYRKVARSEVGLPPGSPGARGHPGAVRSP